jgi:protein involved in polysaccharide export with SLBB domain
MRDRTTPIFRRSLQVLAVALVVSGCSDATRFGGPEQSTAPTSTALQAGDWIKVTVAGETSLSGDFQIDPTGTVQLPLAGPTKAAGMTPTALAEALTKRYRAEYVRDPKVTVSGPRGG